MADDPGEARTPREKAEAELAELQERIASLQAEINQLGRQFWVTKNQIVAEKYDLSANRYREIEQDDAFFEKPTVTLTRMSAIEQHAQKSVAELAKLLGCS
jgi:type I restriction enzyme M protein